MYFYLGKNTCSVFAYFWLFTAKYKRICVAANRSYVFFGVQLRLLHTFLIYGMGNDKMQIKSELLKRYVMDMIDRQFENFEIDVNEIADTTAIKLVEKIRDIIRNEGLSDFDVVEEIVCLFEKYKIDTGNRHDF